MSAAWPASSSPSCHEVLIPNADARGAQDVKALLQQNLDDELRALETAKGLAVRYAHEGWAVNA